MDFLKEFIQQDENKIFLLQAAIWLVSGFFCSLAVSLSSKLEHIKYRKLISLIAFLFNIPATALFFAFKRLLPQKVPTVCSKCGRPQRKSEKTCKKCGNKNFSPLIIENRTELKNRVIFFLVLAVIVAFSGYWLTNYSPYAESLYEDESYSYSEDEAYPADENTVGEYSSVHYAYRNGESVVYYDKFGTSYTDAKSVAYFNKDGAKYYYDGENITDEKGVSKSADEFLTDSNGCILNSYEVFGNLPNVVPFQTSDGVKYYYAKDVSWNSDGEMIYTSNGNPVK